MVKRLSYWQQPILNIDMVQMRKAAHEEMAVYAFKSIRTKEHLTFDAEAVREKITSTAKESC